MAEKVTVFVTFCILLVGGIQAYIYWQQSQTMRESLNQNERTITLGTGQLAVAARNAKTAEDTLAEMKSGGADAHAVAEATKSAAEMAKSTLRLTLAVNRPSITVTQIHLGVKDQARGRDLKIFITDTSEMEATNLVHSCELFLDNKSLKGEIASGTVPGNPVTLGSHITVGLCEGYLPPTIVRRFDPGIEVFDIYVRLTYRGTNRPYSYCEKEEYSRVESTFVDIGTCDPSKPFPQ
jgi:hypothetical protein